MREKIINQSINSLLKYCSKSAGLKLKDRRKKEIGNQLTQKKDRRNADH